MTSLDHEDLGWGTDDLSPMTKTRNTIRQTIQTLKQIPGDMGKEKAEF